MFAAVWLYLYAFGFLTIAGGVAGYVRAKSRASLLAGSIAGALLLVSGYLVGTGARAGLFLGLAVSSSLAVRFVGAFVRSRKVMPAGVMSLLGIAGTVLTALALASLR
ncbi:MAG: hypothetical protein KF819_13900 [Labilithrix sp.]|nr:hypothetical protein [Labilithrix sp.]